jgi:hypothetical protein
VRSRAELSHRLPCPAVPRRLLWVPPAPLGQVTGTSTPATSAPYPFSEPRRHTPAVHGVVAAPNPRAPALSTPHVSPKPAPALPWSRGQAPAASKRWRSSSCRAPRRPRLRCQAATAAPWQPHVELPCPVASLAV